MVYGQEKYRYSVRNVAMVLVAAIALGSSTYAWFVASGSVEAKGMKVQAQAESGILIKEFGSTNAFGTIATVTDAVKMLYPASTNDLSIWYHANSSKADETKFKEGAASDEAAKVYAGSDYKLLNARENDEGAAIIPDDYANDNTALKDYRLVKQFAIRSATQTAMEKSALAITNVSLNDDRVAENFDKSIRIGVKVTSGGDTNSPFFVYAPRSDGQFTLKAGYLTDPSKDGITAKVSVGAEKSDVLILDKDTIPANDTALIVSVFMWYEGEDSDCKTSNLLNGKGGITPDTLSASITFEKVTAPARA